MGKRMKKAALIALLPLMLLGIFIINKLEDFGWLGDEDDGD